MSGKEGEVCMSKWTDDYLLVLARKAESSLEQTLERCRVSALRSSFREAEWDIYRILLLATNSGGLAVSQGLSTTI